MLIVGILIVVVNVIILVGYLFNYKFRILLYIRIWCLDLDKLNYKE